jgi:curved DNA-binding protein
VSLKVPPESEAGRKLRLRGRGLPGSATEPAGDQLVELEIQAPTPQAAGQREAYEALRTVFKDWKRE